MVSLRNIIQEDTGMQENQVTHIFSVHVLVKCISKGFKNHK